MGKMIAGFALLTASAWCQAADAPSSFEVASIRQVQGSTYRGPFESIQVSPNSVTMRGVRFRAAVAWAYGVRDFQVTGPDWMDQKGFEIAAKAAGAVTEEELRGMLRTLLADRFKLEAHQERKETSAYVLTLGKTGLSPAVQKSETDGEPMIQPNPSKMEVSVKRASVSQLVEILAKVLREPVVNETGLDGKFDAIVNISKYVPDGSSAPDIAALAIRAIQQEFGLKVEHRKTMMDFVIVDRAEKAPVEN
jgi:uncharacterized protein (TIGR03435 family)